MTGDAATAYDEVSYPGHPHAQSHPDRLATLATLHGMRPAPVSRCRVLELGCGQGGNLIPIAYQWPDSEFVGIDLSERAIEKGLRDIAGLGLTNIQLRRHDIMEVTAEFGGFDYVIAHGVYSWVPPAVRAKVLSILKEHLAPHGVGYVSYNCYPGSRLRDLAREMMLYHVRDISDPRQKIQQGRALMKFLAETSGEQETYGRVMRSQFSRIQKTPDEVLYHDDLDPDSAPFFLHQVAAEAARHGLQYLADATSPLLDLNGLPAPARTMLEQFPVHDIVEREQYVDFIRGRGFRETLLCSSEVELRRDIGPQSVRDYYVAALAAPVGEGSDPVQEGVATFRSQRGSTLSIDHRLSKAALSHLGQIWPQAVSFPNLLDGARIRLGDGANRIGGSGDEDVAALATVLFRGFCGGQVELHRCPPRLTTAIGARPEASRVARRQAAEAAAVTNLRHGTVALKDEAVRRFLTLVDGRRDADQLVAALNAALEGTGGAASRVEVTREGVAQNLRMLASLGLLVA
jgi:SAM-dependent methyltransferase